MVLSPRTKAFSLDQEPDRMRDLYGRSAFGQGCLMARRLVEAGVTFVEVQSSGWDTHGNELASLKKLIPPVDQATAALLADLKARGLLEKTLVIWMGEFGRTPHINVTAGRDHYPHAFNVALAGSGVQRRPGRRRDGQGRRRGGRAAGDGAGPVLHVLQGAGHRPANGEPEQRRPAAQDRRDGERGGGSVRDVRPWLASYCMHARRKVTDLAMCAGSSRMTRIKIVGFGDAKAVEDIFGSSMVDVAYVDEVTSDAIYVVGDIGIDFERPGDFAWVKEVIETTLAQHDVRDLGISLART